MSPSPDTGAGTPPRRALRRRIAWGAPALAGLAAGILAAHSASRAAHAGRDPAVATPTVAVARVGREDLYREITVPAEFRAYNEVDVHAKVSGYVHRINVDIGDRVKTGQLLAVLEIPELGDELDHAVAARERATAEYQDAHLAYTRLVEVNREHPNLVAQQDIDTARARDAMADGALAAATSDVRRYRALVDYTRITAPFDGIVTRRYADPGALIQAGTASQTQAMPLVRLSDNRLLRLDFPVSVDYVRSIRIGQPVTVQVDSLGERSFQGRVTRFAGRIDDSTRTMTVETEVPNPRYDIVPGMYAHVTLKVDQHSHALTVPVEAISPGSRTVLMVDAGGRLAERTVTLGIETSTSYEVLSGLSEGDLVMIGNPAMLNAGQQVRTRLAASGSAR